MHVKESVKDFVHGVKRKFSQKHKRDSCSTCTADSDDGASSDSSVDSHCHLETTRHSVSSSSISSLPGTLERSRFIPFVRPRTPSTSSQNHPHNVIHKARKLNGKRSRFFSLRVPHSNLSHATGETQLNIQGSPGLIRDAANEVGTIGSSQKDYTDVIDISARSVKMGSVEESTQSSLHHTSSFVDNETYSDTSRTLVTATSGSGHTKFVSGCSDTVDSYSHRVHDIVPLVSSPPHDTSVSQFDIETHSKSSGTLITVASGPESVSESSHSRSDMFDSYSDRNAVSLVSSPPSIYPMAEASEVPPVPPPKSEKNLLPHAAADSSREEMITLAHSASSSSPPPVVNLDTSIAAPSLSPPVVPQASRAATPAQPIKSTFGSPAPVYIPRLTAPSMFLPIPNVRLIFPLSHPLVWWLAPRWLSGTSLSSSVSMFLPRSGNKSTFVTPQPTLSHSHFTLSSSLFPNYSSPPSPHSR
ncbi:hypothetical protein J3R83DRAFT_8486 [Lanmaoa asiatica]|nr:hypothetical protein J3R83DRAFT_8486 [Lanmaoa asiatica]